jgi:hypothetical protein
MGQFCYFGTLFPRPKILENLFSTSRQTHSGYCSPISGIVFRGFGRSVINPFEFPSFHWHLERLRPSHRRLQTHYAVPIVMDPWHECHVSLDRRHGFHRHEPGSQSLRKNMAVCSQIHRTTQAGAKPARLGNAEIWNPCQRKGADISR